MSELDFWNLAGRAGRWGKEFQGNVICIDTQDPAGWPNVPTVRGRFALSRAVPSGLSQPEDLIEYLKRADNEVSPNPNGENLFSYLATRMINGSDLRSELAEIRDSKIRTTLYDRVEQTLSDLEFPRLLVPRHAGISPISMTKLLINFRASNLSASALALPRPAQAQAKARYQMAFVRLGSTMTLAFGRTLEFGDDKRKWQIANLVVNWMKGMPLARLIEQRLSGNTPLPKAIRDVMSDIETVVRFQSAKYLACYNDILAVYAAERRESVPDEAFDVTMMLELGVSRPSQVALMSVGLSRGATLAISDLIAAETWTTTEALMWLRVTNFDEVNIPPAFKREIAALARPSKFQQLPPVSSPPETLGACPTPATPR